MEFKVILVYISEFWDTKYYRERDPVSKTNKTNRLKISNYPSPQGRKLACFLVCEPEH